MICTGAAKLYVGAVARRIEIELTSARPDGTWTWRAAGALNPRGTLDGSLLYEAAKAGDVVRAEAEFGIEGITVVAVEPPRPTETTDPNRIELIERPTTAGVTTQLTGGRGRPGPDGGPDRRRGDQGGGQRRGRPSQRPTPTGAGGGSDQSDSNGNGRGARDGHGDSALGPTAPERTARPVPTVPRDNHGRRPVLDGAAPAPRAQVAAKPTAAHELTERAVPGRTVTKAANDANPLRAKSGSAQVTRTAMPCSKACRRSNSPLPSNSCAGASQRCGRLSILTRARPGRGPPGTQHGGRPGPGRVAGLPGEGGRMARPGRGGHQAGGRPRDA